MKIYVNGAERTDFRPYSTNIQNSVNERSTGSVEFLNRGPMPGSSVTIYDDSNNLIFGGYVARPSDEKQSRTSIIYSNVDLVDNSSIADRRIVAESYENQTVGYIARDILTKYLSSEGVTEGTIEEGPVVTKAVFPYEYASKALNDLAELSGFSWNITADKKLVLAGREMFVAPWSINDSSSIRNIRVERDQDQYRNRQFIRAGQDITDTQTESFSGDGNSRTFVVGYKIAQVPTIRINGVVKTVGIRGVEEGKDVYWSKGEKEITQEFSATPLTSADKLEIDYVGFFPIIVVSEDSPAIQGQKSLSGGTGIYESVEENTNIDSAQAALEFAQGKLRRFARTSTTLTYETYVGGLEAGQLIDVSLPYHALSGQFLISSVEISEYSPGKLRYNVKAVDGEAVGGWANFFAKLSKSSATFVIRENEVLIRLTTQNERLGWKELQTQTVHACPIPSSVLYPALTLYPC
jgi:hypothetical protein